MQLESDVRKLINLNESDFEKMQNEFIHFGIKTIHKKFLFDKNFDDFLLRLKSNFISFLNEYLRFFLEKSELTIENNFDEKHLQSSELVDNDKKYVNF